MTLAERLSKGEVLAMTAAVFHARRGALKHRFRTSADFVLLSPETALLPALMGRNRFNLTAFYDKDHGGARGQGAGAAWAWQQFASMGLQPIKGRVLALLTQPRFLGFWFNPVSFWLLLDGDDLRAVIAEVNNTFGQRHSYLLTAPELAPILPETVLSARKVFHVSPFQEVKGSYHFRLSLTPERIHISIRQVDGEAGVETLMQGGLLPLTPWRILKGAVRRPGGAFGVLVQIYWHAFRLRLKGAGYRRLPNLPSEEISK